MAHSLIVSEPADKSVDKILDYLDQGLSNQSAALSWLDCLHALFENLVDHPEMFPFARDPRIAAKGIRVAPVKNYIVAYRVSNDDKTVFIVNVFYGAMKYQDYL
jgi:plasmid stabilization system protein ParE